MLLDLYREIYSIRINEVHLYLRIYNRLLREKMQYNNFIIDTLNMRRHMIWQYDIGKGSFM